MKNSNKNLPLILLFILFMSCESKRKMDCKLDSNYELLAKEMLEYSKINIPEHKSIGTKQELDQYFKNMLINEKVEFNKLENISSSDSICNCSVKVKMSFKDRFGVWNAKGIPKQFRTTFNEIKVSLEKPYNLNYTIHKDKKKYYVKKDEKIKKNRTSNDSLLVIDDRYIIDNGSTFEEEISGRLFDYINLSNITGLLHSQIKIEVKTVH